MTERLTRCVYAKSSDAVKIENVSSPPYGAIAQLGERIVRNDEVVGSSPTSSTNLLNVLATIAAISVTLKWRSGENHRRNWRLRRDGLHYLPKARYSLTLQER